MYTMLRANDRANETNQPSKKISRTIIHIQLSGDNRHNSLQLLCLLLCRSNAFQAIQFQTCHLICFELLTVRIRRVNVCTCSADCVRPRTLPSTIAIIILCGFLSLFQFFHRFVHSFFASTHSFSEFSKPNNNKYFE